MGSDNSTGNFIVHLATHRITEESHRRRMSEIRNNNQLSQPRIDEIIRNNPDINVIVLFSNLFDLIEDVLAKYHFNQVVFSNAYALRVVF